MTAPLPTTRRWTRRGVVTAAAWSAPAIVVVTAAPALAAASPAGTLSISPGSARAVHDLDGYYDLDFTGFVVQASGPTILSDGLTLTTLFTPTDTAASRRLTVFGDPSPWTISPGAGDADSVVMTYPGAVSGEVAVPADTFFGTAVVDVAGTFVVTAAAPGYSSASQPFATTAGRSARVAFRRPDSR